MTWARLDDGFWRNEKVIACPDAALGLHVRAISYCADQRTEGRISKAALLILRAKPSRVAELVDAGLWDEIDGDYAVHDFLKYNPSVAESDSKRDAKRIAGAKGAASRWHSGGNAPDPIPTRTHPDPSSSSSARSARQWYEHVTGKLIGQDKALRQQLDDVQAAHGFECVEWGFTAAIGKDEPWLYAKRIFDSCMIGGEGHGPRTRTRRNDLRPQGGGNHRGKPSEPDDWVERSRLEQIERRRALGRPTGDEAGLAAADVV